jgi:CDP-4-dehydro-6-deoxyglucose reductase/ferredoxin-NAD(P)+ reductase (naphthalene dioxygenase ferredoxin-specific)
MSYKITLNEPNGEHWADIDVEPGRPILHTALAHGLDYPHGCQSGNCGGCKSYLIEGEVEMSPYSDFALTAEEKSRGLILACRAVPWSDCLVQPIAPDDAAVHASRLLDCTIAAIEQATHDIRIVRLKYEDDAPFEYAAGQYASLKFGTLPPRDFSMATPAALSSPEFHIRLAPGGLVTSHVMNEISLGDRVQLRGPMGTAHYRPNHRGPMLLIAGGSGLAPIKAICEEALTTGRTEPITMYFGARTERDIYLEQHFKELADQHPHFSFTTILSEPDGATSRRTGYLADTLATDFADLTGYKAYLAGPPVMVESCTAILTVGGLSRRDCHADAFYTEAEKNSSQQETA